MLKRKYWISSPNCIPTYFSILIDYCAKNEKYLDETIAVFDREIQFYIAYLEYIATIQTNGIEVLLIRTCPRHGRKCMIMKGLM